MKKDNDNPLGDALKNMPEDEFRELYDELGEKVINLVQTEDWKDFSQLIPEISEKEEEDITDDDMAIVDQFYDMIESIGEEFFKKYPELKELMIEEDEDDE